MRLHEDFQDLLTQTITYIYRMHATTRIVPQICVQNTFYWKLIALSFFFTTSVHISYVYIPMSYSQLRFKYLYKKSHVNHKCCNNANHKAQDSICHGGRTNININLQK